MHCTTTWKDTTVASKSFHINTEPHTAIIGDVTLSFEAEVIGAEFASAYAGLKVAQKQITDAGDNVGEAELLAVNKGMREFVSRFLLPESKRVFDRFEINYKDQVEAFTDSVAAAARAEELGVTDTLVDKSLKLPDRVLVQLLEFVAGLYGGGSGNAPGGSSSES